MTGDVLAALAVGLFVAGVALAVIGEVIARPRPWLRACYLTCSAAFLLMLLAVVVS